MSQQAHDLRASAQASITGSKAKCLGSHNDCSFDSVRADSKLRGDSALRACVGCGRRFVYSGPQRYCSHACYAEHQRVPIEARFWTRINKNGPAPAHLPQLGPCWLFTGKARLREYGSVAGRKNGKPWPRYAHRVAWELTYGAIPEGLSVLHKCDTPLCCRPEHLFIGTQADNLNDARRKNRLIDGLGARKLSDDAYREILASRGYGSNLAMARKHGVSKTTISRIRAGVQGSTYHRSRPKPNQLEETRAASDRAVECRERVAVSGAGVAAD